jgi:mannose-6-phosphate isomerase
LIPSRLYPLTFTPVLKDYLWGGRNLERLYGRKLPDGVIAESWEIAAHEDGTAVVDNGPFTGWGLDQLHAELGLDLVGRNAFWAQALGKFPLLVKLLDANHNLSVQVHPDDEYALANESNELGKTEMWVVLQAEPRAAVILGVTAGTTREGFRQAIVNGELEPFLHRIQVRRGDVVCVPPGSVHAILGGSVLAEIQQNSNMTYRVFDWNRLHGGKPRPLHVDKALEVINFDQVEPGLAQPEFIPDANGIRRYAFCGNRYFMTERLEMEADAIFEGHCDGSTCEIWGTIDGEVLLNQLILPAVRFSLLPAAIGAFAVRAIKTSTLLRTYIGLASPPDTLPRERNV